MHRSPSLLRRARAQIERVTGTLGTGATGRGWRGDGPATPLVELVRPLGSRRTMVLHIAWREDGGAELWEPLSPAECRALRAVVHAARNDAEAAATVTHWDVPRKRRTMIHMETAEGGILVTLSLLHAGGRAARSVRLLTTEQLAPLG